MSIPLAMGTNQRLTSPDGEVVVEHTADPSVDVNLTAFVVTAAGTVRDDHDMVFYNQPAGPEGCATFHPPEPVGGVVRHRLAFDLSRLPAGTDKIVVALTEDANAGFARVPGLTARVDVAGTATFDLAPPPFSDERGIMVAEIYVRNGEHKVRSIWQGFASGLAGLAAAHGIETDEADSSAPAAPASAPTPSTPPPPPPPPAAPAAPASASSVNLQKVSGSVSLVKGDRAVIMEKTPLMTASVSWSSGTDYDVYALVWTREGRQVDVAMFGAEGVPALQEHAGVRHHGDVQRPDTQHPAATKRRWGGKGGAGSAPPPPPPSGPQVERIDIRLSPEVVAVVPVAYSAQSNGSGSFHRYRVSLTIDNGAGTAVTIDSVNANQDDHVYTCVPGIIRNTDQGVVVEPLELYSVRNSELRPRLQLGPDGAVQVVMDQGPKNDYK